ncbi:hypothetical protein ASESINO_92 [Erwinia phage vB_EamM_Asesino]|uniref:Uncharacterized protein n=1 Tax=Erwinia phage vB_EamM_Asesino TaxID=1883370 RepID=A0A1B2IA56_9CAUD|nr:hypothetical protein ASESINO_92 [Erwinia phage vB_EamM_Asesino]ANZ48105.1 hypothetical protein ASESINO_92 [Erwinia phage vB_EamM_Asesino]
MKEFDIGQVINVKATAVGVIVTVLDRDSHFHETTEIAYPLHAFDILQHFLTVKHAMLKGDFGKYKEYETTRIKDMRSIILGDVMCKLTRYSFPESKDEPEIISNLEGFLKKLGLYQPHHFPVGIQEWRDHARVIPFNIGRDVNELRSLTDALRESYTPQCELMENLRIYGRYIDPQYTFVIPERGDIATGGYWVEPPHNPHIVPNSPYIPFNFASVRLHQLADVLNGIAQMDTLPNGGFEVRMVNGLGNISLATLEKEDLRALVKAIAR